MSDLGPAEVTAYAVGAGGAGKFVWDFIQSRLAKADKMEAADAAEQQADVKKVLELTQKIERDVALLSQQSTTQAGVVSGLAGRLDGMSSNYGARLQKLETDLVALSTEVRLILARRRK